VKKKCAGGTAQVLINPTPSAPVRAQSKVYHNASLQATDFETTTAQRCIGSSEAVFACETDGDKSQSGGQSCLSRPRDVGHSAKDRLSQANPRMERSGFLLC
jgi:hypothetical protein